MTKLLPYIMCGLDLDLSILNIDLIAELRGGYFVNVINNIKMAVIFTAKKKHVALRDGDFPPRTRFFLNKNDETSPKIDY